jgi:hypothetical protein
MTRFTICCGMDVVGWRWMWFGGSKPSAWWRDHILGATLSLTLSLVKLSQLTNRTISVWKSGLVRFFGPQGDGP